MDTKINEVYIFGAGASKAKVNLPLGNELVWQLPASHSLHLDDQHFIEFLQIASIEYPELGCEIDRYKRSREENHIYMPSVFINENKKYYIDEILRRVITKRNFEHINLIKKLIVLHINSLSLNPVNILYNNFVKKCPLNGIGIITLNFDTLLSQAFTDNSIWIDYKLKFNNCPHGLYSENFIKDWRIVSILKLNGSVDWGICSKCQSLTRYYEEVEYHNYGNCSKCNSSNEPFIVIPYDHFTDIINGLWSEAQYILANAKRINIIGYSFPAYDNTMLEIFSKSIQENSDVNLKVVDYCNTPQEKNAEYNKIKGRYKKLFGKEPNISLDGFELFLEKHLD